MFHALSSLTTTSLFPKFELKSNQNHFFQGLTTNALATLIANHFEIKQQSCLVIAENEKSAEIFQHDFKYWTNDLSLKKSVYFPYLYSRYPNIPESLFEKMWSCLATINPNQPQIIITTRQALLQKIPSFNDFQEQNIQFKTGNQWSLSKISEILIDYGFNSNNMVEEIGQYSIRGDILDIYPYLYDNPVRIEFFGNEIESIREFNLLTQRSIKSLKQVVVASQSKEHFDILADVSLVEWLPQNTTIFYEQTANLENILDKTAQHIQSSLTDYETHFVKTTTLQSQLQNYSSIFDCHVVTNSPNFQSLDVEPQPIENGKLDFLKTQINDLIPQEFNFFLLVANENQANKMKSLINDDNVTILLGDIEKGFIDYSHKVAIFSSRLIFNLYIPQTNYSKHHKKMSILDLKVLNRGDIIVHEDYGIGRYRGIKTLKINNHFADCVLLEYEQGTITLSIQHLNRIYKKSLTNLSTVKLDSLKKNSWKTRKSKAKESVVKFAKELIELYAKRTHTPGFSYKINTDLIHEFENNCPFELTTDQVTSLQQVKQDMVKPQPMDRLVYGDVGFGKTEIAIRAAFIAVYNKKQVAILVPTTLLASQHYANFSQRMSMWPIEVDFLNRFKNYTEQKKTISNLKAGKIDIIIGTHKLLSKQLEFKELGLLIIDEEQKFGVSQKEKLKELKTDIDCLCLSATPIPRTLHFSMTGIRDFSIISTPPQNRLPVNTFISKFDNNSIRKLLQAEIDRGGQCFFVLPHISDLTPKVELLQMLLPNTKIEMVHGKMNENELEKIMIHFIQKNIDILVATSLIESGIDLPNVNTVIIDKANHFGLSSLYQIRGRVGRGDTQAYCMLIPAEKITINAQQRLNTLEQFTELGVGYNIAMRDLEIRGAGNLLGSKQNGHIENIGFDAFCRLLKDTLLELQNQPPESSYDIEIECGLDAFLPQNFIEDNSQRVSIYQKITQVNNIEDLENLKLEIQDRFGTTPSPVINLIDIAKIKILCKPLSIKKVILKKSCQFFINHKERYSTPLLQNLIQKSPYQILFREELHSLKNQKTQTLVFEISPNSYTLKNIIEALIIWKNCLKTKEE